MIRHLSRPPRVPADALGRDVWKEIAREFAAGPPLTVHAAQPEVFAAVWAVLRETVLVPGLVPREIKEAIATAVSAANECPYCVDVHTLLQRAARQAAAEAELAAAIDWASACNRPGDSRLSEPPFGRDQAPEMIGTAAAFTYINRIVSVLVDGSPLPAALRFLKTPLGWIGGHVLVRMVRRPLTPGLALARLPEAEVPPTVGWARSRPNVAAAFARLGAATDRAVASVMAPGARARVLAVLAGWRGEAPPFGRRWLEDPSAGLTPRDSNAVRLALLTALAPARVTAEDVAAFASDQPGDAALVALLAWSAYQTTERAASWLRGPF